MHFLISRRKHSPHIYYLPLLGPGAGERRILDSTKSEEIWVSSCFLAWEQQHTGQHPSQHIAAQLYILLYFFDSLVFMTKMFHDILCQFLKTYINYRSVQVQCPLTSKYTAKMKTSQIFACTSLGFANSLSSNRKRRKERIYDDKEGLTFRLPNMLLNKFNIFKHHHDLSFISEVFIFFTKLTKSMIHRTECGENLIRAQQELTNPIANNLFLSLPPSHLTFNSINTLIICFLFVKKYAKIYKTCTLFLFLFKKYPT